RLEAHLYFRSGKVSRIPGLIGGDGARAGGIGPHRPPGERAHSWRDAAELHGAAGAATHRGDGIPSADVPRVRWRRREDDALLRPRLPLLVPPPALEGVVAPYRAVE